PREPRPGRQLDARRPPPCPGEPGELPGADRPPALGAGLADALPGAGVRRLDPVRLLRRPQTGPGPAGARRAPRVPLPVPQPGGGGGPGRGPRSRRPGELRALEARLRRAAAPRRGLRPPPRPLAPQAERPDAPFRPAGGRRGARSRDPGPALLRPGG